jgi:hypothetical protein
VILFPAGCSEPVTLAGSGPELWALMATPSSLAELAASLARVFDRDEDALQSDLRPVIEQLVTLGAAEAA